MNKKLTQFRWLAAMIMLVTAMAMPSVAWAQISPSKPSGEGTAANPYQIGSAAELYWFAALVNGDTNVDGVTAANKAACAELTQNIKVNSGVLQSDGSLADASGFTAWTPISTDDENPYTGTFDGKGYTISGLYFNNTNKSYYIGLFGYVGSGSKICNVGIVDSYFNGWSGIGGVCGYCISGGEITNCYNTGTVIGTGDNIGGVCGYNSGTITDCYNTGNVSGTSTSDQEGRVGGVCGCNSGYPNMSTITRSYNSGKVSGGYCVGGVCGANGYGYPAKTINCYNTGEVTGTNDFVGGICGYNGVSDSRIENCYNSAAVSGSSYVGSVCGLNHAVITTCYYLTTESELSGVGESGTNAVSNAHGKIADQFNSGEVCYLLNASEEVFTWRQNLNSDNLPVLDESHGKVYASAPCPAHFSNSQSDLAATEHSYKDGVCEVCGEVDIRPEMIDGVYQLTTSEQLYWFAEQVNGNNKDQNAVLLNDIIVNSGEVSASTEDAKVWKPIGNDIAPYTGTFDGKGHTISGLYFNDISESSGQYVGLFGKIGSGGSVSNVNVTNSYFNGNEHVGGICGCNEGSIANCHVQGILSAKYYAGGVCGSNIRGTITNCYNTGTVSGVTFGFGGVCGQNYGTITNCYNTGTVSCPNYKIGGVCGSNSETITNCYYLSGTADGGIMGSEDVTGSAESKTETQFNSGEVALLLNGGTTDGSQAWYQNLSEQSGDAYPVLKSTEGNTVYGGYNHGGNTGKFSNTASVIPEGYIHLHAYNLSAADEANGNHDMSYDGQFTWADTDDKTNATVTATFTCSVCGKVVEPEMTVVHDDEHPNTPAACTEVGYNYFKTSHAFTGAIFTDSYTQTVPVLGHKMNIRTFNEYKKIYSNQCQRENCGYIGYYATSDGSVEARYEDGVYKVPFLCLYDAKAYDSKAEYTVTSLAYKRKFYDDKWMAVYVPFAIDCSNLDADYEMATINNFHEYEQEDGTYNVVLEVKRVTKGGTIPALTPCLIRMKTAPAEEVEKTLTFENAEFSAAADKSIDCSSVTRYYQFTGSLSGKTGLTAATDFVLNAGKLYKTSESTVLLPQRWYLSATDRTSTPVEPATMLRSISINVIGDGEATGIEDIQVNTESGAAALSGTGIYDLQGRKINSEPSKGMYIKNGKKFIK